MVILRQVSNVVSTENAWFPRLTGRMDLGFSRKPESSDGLEVKRSQSGDEKL